MEAKRVAITGMGAISPVGLDVESMMAALYAGRGGVAAIERFDPAGLTTRIAAER